MFSSLRDVLHLRGNDRAAWEEIVQELGLKGGITPDNRAVLHAKVQQARVQALRKIFREVGDSLSVEKLQELEERWGDVEPVLTLFARFQKNRAWRQEIPVLNQVFRAVLEKKFKDLKFHGDPKTPSDQKLAQAQLAVLSTVAKRKAWMKARSRVESFDAEKAQQVAAADRHEALDHILRTNLKHHLDESVRTAPALGGADLQQLNRLVESFGDKTFFLTGLQGKEPSVLAELLSQITREKDLSRRERLVDFLVAHQDQFPVSASVRDDFRSLSRVFHGSTQADPALIVTTTFSDARTLLTVGDLVDAASCQNYKTGEMIETLLGYVIDANVQGIASFVVRAHDFARPQDFSAVMEAAWQGRLRQPLYKGDRRQVTFILQEGSRTRRITTQPIERAFSLAMLKLGTSSEDERSPALFAQKEDIVQELARELGARLDTSVEIVRSRNPGGVYSDAGNGIEKEDYTIMRRR